MEEKYIKQLLPNDYEWVAQLKAQAKQKNVPIMEPLGMQFLMQLIRLHKPKKILEIGTGIGYSALRMVQAYPHTKVTSIERDVERFRLAEKNIFKNKYKDQIELVLGDALDILPTLSTKERKFDMVFIDAAKGQYQKFFDRANLLVPKDGVIISDNVLFRGYVADETFNQPKYRSMIKKIRQYNQWIHEHPQYVSTITPIGDGVAISYKIKENT